MTIQAHSQQVYQQLNGNILPFWQTQAIDSDFGGYVGLMDINGEVEPMADKSAIAHARILWSFSAAYRALIKASICVRPSERISV